MNFKKTLTFLASSVVSTGSLTLPLAVLAASPFETGQGYVDQIATGADIGAPKSLPEIVGNIINIVLSFLGILLLIYLLVAGFLWMTAGGDEKKTETSKTMIKNAIIGLIIIVAAFAISNFVLTQITENLISG